MNTNPESPRGILQTTETCKLKGRNVLITGGSSGIGHAAALLFLEHGANVILTGRNPEKLQETESILLKLGVKIVEDNDLDPIPKEDLSQGGYALIQVSDAGDLKNISSLLEHVKKVFGELDVLFLNAGVVNASPIDEVTEESFDDIFNINTKGIFFTIQKSLPIMRENGSIVTITSVSNQRCAPNFSVYAASKAALWSLTKSFAVTAAKKNIRVNAISPGPVKTDGFNKIGLSPDLLSEKIDELTNRTILHRFAFPNEIANVALFLASSDSSFVTGSEFIVDGGMSINVQ